ncbi:MAG: isopentenyl phosphate kinase [Candidatus Falkowbacteria bacterium]|nr:isopentenyl phosphate kinase [Candidatus Falkowbacteria bacterium]
MKNLYILKLGGSVVTHKDEQDLKIRKELLQNIALNLKKIIEDTEVKLVIIHGAGSYGHRLAKKYNLQDIQSQTDINWQGVLETKLSVQKLNTEIAEIFLNTGVHVLPIHPSSIVIQDNSNIDEVYLETIKKALENNLVPLLYGDMTFDKAKGISICSGDKLVPYLSEKLGAKKIIYATDVAGIFNKDPHLNKDVKLIKNILIDNGKIELISGLEGSHSEDVTDGLRGKIKELNNLKKTQEIIIFNGLKIENYLKVFNGFEFDCTKIKRA